MKSIALHLGQVFLNDQASRFIPDRPVRMGRQRQRMLEDLRGLRIFLLLKEKIAVKVVGIQPIRRVLDCLLQQMPRLGLVAEAERESRNPIIEHAEARGSAGVQRRRIDFLDRLQNLARTLASLSALIGLLFSLAIEACSLMRIPSQIMASGWF